MAAPTAATAPAGTAAKAPKLTVIVDKPTPYYFDLGLLLANDPNPLNINQSDPLQRETDLAAVARDGAQSLINQLLTTCQISSTPHGVLLSLPPPQTALPREKPIPAPKAETKWSAFAKRRGIAPKTREQRRNLELDEKTGEFGRRWGYKGANKAGQDEPIIELNAAKEAARKEGTTVRGDKRREIREKVRRNDRRMRKNERNAESAKK
ncbi:ribosomal biogenesis regulatory protein [Lasiosphaeris hirsuta]|uniref:Ribosome biogenesis regulatory protein n=1 Tax=Lasiosphaeris hirsuta TaxID=260670 RepID=A0AA40BCR1_9PEZI|nr:ribosomal biogenesis regulatory protein [Lasiosphaeris hirsuta]